MRLIQSKIAVTMLTLCTWCATAQAQSDTWVCADELGRTVASSDEGVTRESMDPNQVVGMFYYIWQGQHGVEKKSVTSILNANPDKPEWGEYYQYHWGGKPWYNYYVGGDRYIIAKHMQMLMDAGIDFYFFDTTNAVLYPDQVKAVMAEIDRRTSLGLKVPKLVFTVHTNPGATVKMAIDRFYSSADCDKYWFTWQGKPLVLGSRSESASTLTTDELNMFTWRNCWAWMNGANQDEWAWLENYPQAPGWTLDANGNRVVEQLSVSVAQHPMSNIGKSYHNGAEPTVDKWGLTEMTPYGLYFQEQMRRAREVQPPVLMITQWNEWIAMRFPGGTRPGAVGEGIGDGYFVDVYNQEFCRDLEPSSEPLIRDNYYMLLCSELRKYRGANKIPVPTVSKTITINDDFSQWADVDSVFTDEPCDVQYQKTDAQTPSTLKRTTNDIVLTKVTKDNDNLYFYVRTRGILSPMYYSSTRWMTLLLNTDCDYSSGWGGYNYMITNKDGKMMLQYSFAGENYWIDKAEIKYYYTGNELHMCVPRALVGNTTDADFDFKWTDNTDPDNGDIMQFYSDGDCAPNWRFNFRYKGSELATSGVSEALLKADFGARATQGGEVQFSAPAQPQASKIEVFDATGRQVATVMVPAGESVVSATLPQGVLVCRYTAAGTQGVAKVVNKY